MNKRLENNIGITSKKILVMVENFLPQPSANGACLESLVKELNVCGYTADIINFSKNDNSFDYDCNRVYNINCTTRVFKSKFFNKVKNGFYQLRNYPIDYKKVIRKAESYAEKLISENCYEFMLCVIKPVDTALIGVALKDKHKDLPFVLYEADSLTDNLSNSEGWSKYFASRNKRIEEKIYNKADIIFHFEGHRKYYEAERYAKYCNKTLYVDIPLIEAIVPTKHIRGESKTINCIYCGVLVKSFRSPEYLISLLEKVNQSLPVSCCFYTRGNCEKLLKQKENSGEGIVFAKGYVEKSELDREVANADIVISIGNGFKEEIGSVPSKIFYYMSMGKRIVHFASVKNDTALPYLKKYPNCLIIDQSDDFEKNVSAFIAFVTDKTYTDIDFEFLQKSFEKNTSAYTINLLLKKIEEDKK